MPSTGALGGATGHGHLGRQARHRDGRGGCGGGPHNSLRGTVFHHLTTADSPDAEPLEAALMLCSAGPKTLTARIACYSKAVVHDPPIAALPPGQPYNRAVIALGSCPGINMAGHLVMTRPAELPKKGHR